MNALDKICFQTALKKRKSALSSKKVTRWMQQTTARYQSQVHFQKFLSESYINKQNHVQKFELMNPLQFGCQTGVSTADAFLFSIESNRKIIDSKSIVQTALLDLSKAFDSLSHDILIEKLKKLLF